MIVIGKSSDYWQAKKAGCVYFTVCFSIMGILFAHRALMTGVGSIFALLTLELFATKQTIQEPYIHLI